MSLPGYPLAYHANLKAGYPPASDHNLWQKIVGICGPVKNLILKYGKPEDVKCVEWFKRKHMYSKKNS